MSNVVALPTNLTASEAWERYAALVREANADRELWADLDHCKAIARAWKSWCEVYSALESVA